MNEILDLRFVNSELICRQALDNTEMWLSVC